MISDRIKSLCKAAFVFTIVGLYFAHLMGIRSATNDASSETKNAQMMSETETSETVNKKSEIPVVEINGVTYAIIDEKLYELM